jgi:serine/threonine-protein kinase
MTDMTQLLPAGLVAVRAIDEHASLGPVWEAERDGVPVAVKLIHLLSQEVKARAQREILANWSGLRSVRAGGLVAFLDGGLDPTAWVVSELLRRAVRWQDELDRGAVPLVRVIEIATQASAGLWGLHSAGLAHRALEANDLLLVELPAAPPLVKVNNAWRGAIIAAMTKYETRTGWGTRWRKAALYMAPEAIDQRAPEGSGPPADIYSLGAILYHALAGEPPFRDDNMILILAAHVSKPLPPLPASVPPRLASLVATMMAKKPAGRPTIAEVSRALLELRV